MTRKELARIAVTGALVAAAALPALAQTATIPMPSTTTAKPMTTKIAPKPLDVACISSAVDRRDTAIAGVFDTLKSAVMTRRDALKSAWSQTDQKTRRTALKAAWKAYTGSVSSARSARKAAWTAFYTDRKSCGAGATTDDTATQAVDQSL